MGRTHIFLAECQAEKALHPHAKADLPIPSMRGLGIASGTEEYAGAQGVSTEDENTARIWLARE